MYVPSNSSKIDKPSLDKPACQMDGLYVSHAHLLVMPQVDTLFQESGNNLSALEYDDRVNFTLVPKSMDLLDQLFFI